MSIEEIAVLLGWCTVVNIGILMLTVVILTLFRKPVQALHTKMTGLSADDLNQAYFQYMGQFKIFCISGSKPSALGGPPSCGKPISSSIQRPKSINLQRSQQNGGVSVSSRRNIRPQVLQVNLVGS